MSTVTIDNMKNRKRVVLTVLPRKFNFLMELLQNFDFVSVENVDTCDTREEIMTNLKQAAKELILVKEGKVARLMNF